MTFIRVYVTDSSSPYPHKVEAVAVVRKVGGISWFIEGGRGERGRIPSWDNVGMKYLINPFQTIATRSVSLI